MHKAFAAAALVWSLIQTPGRALELADLTVPGSVLPTGCALSAAPSERIEGNRFRSGLWAELPIRTNPWLGADAPIVASIVARLQPAAVVPDGPPQTPNEAARFQLHLADGVEQAYAAVYRSGDAGALAVVYGIKFANDDAARAFVAARTRA